MRTGVRTDILEIMLLLVCSGRSRGQEKKEREKKNVAVRSARDTDVDGVYDEDGPPRAASALPSRGGRGRAGSGFTRRRSLEPVSPSGSSSRLPGRRAPVYSSKGRSTG